MTRVLELMPPAQPQSPITSMAPPRRRRMMTPDEVASEKFAGKRSERWVREHVPGDAKVPHGSRPPLYFEDLIDVWVYGMERA